MNDSRRDSNFGRRQSFSGSVNTGPPPLSVNVTIRDPRPIKDKAFQRTLIHNLVNFLIQSGFQYVITTKNLYQPTNKIFQDIFKFLYLKLEPGHEFQKKFEDEVPSLLTIMRYPAPESITRSSLQAVGQPHSWPNMLALLGWMMDVILIMDRIKEILDALPMGGGMSRGGGDLNPKLDMTKVPPDDALYYYLTKTYRVWMLTGNVRDPDMEAQMALSLQRRKAQLEDEANRLADVNESMRLELERAREEGSSIVVLEKEQLTLRQDIDRFQKAFEHAEPRIEGVRKANAEKQASIAAKKEEYAAVERAKVELREIIRSQTLTRADLESKVEELTRLKRREESLNKQLQDLKQELRAVDERNQRSEYEAENLVREYNELAVKIGIVPRSAMYAGGQDYELRPDLDSGASDSGKLFSSEVRSKAERAISALKSTLSVTQSETNNDLFILKEELETVKDQIEECNGTLSTKEHQFNLLNRKFQEEKETARADQMNRQAFMENQQEQVQAMMQDNAQNQAEIERLEKENKVLEQQAAQNREMYTRQIKEMLEQMTLVKQHVEQQVGVMRAMASKELEDTRNRVVQAQHE